MSFSSMPPLALTSMDAETEISKGLLTDEEVPSFRPRRASKIVDDEDLEDIVTTAVGTGTGTGTSTDEDDDWISDLVPRTTFIFVRHTQADFKFFKGATHKYELLDAKGVRILFGKESPSLERHIGIGVHVVIHVLTLNGEEVFRMEGHRGGPRPKFAVYTKKTFLGDIISIKKKCTEPSFHIVDKNSDNIAFIRLSEESKKARGNCLKHCCGFSKTDEDNLIFDIFGPRGRTRIGGIGLGVAKFFPEIPAQLDKCMGIELLKSAEMKDKLILMGTMFIRPIPKSPESQTDSKQNNSKLTSSSSNSNPNNDTGKIIVTSAGDDGNSVQIQSDTPEGYETKSTSMDSLTDASENTMSFEEITVYDD